MLFMNHHAENRIIWVQLTVCPVDIETRVVFNMDWTLGKHSLGPLCNFALHSNIPKKKYTKTCLNKL